MSKVSLEDVSEHMVLVGLAGPDSHKLLTQAVDQAPNDDYQTNITDTLCSYKLPGSVNRYMLLGLTEKMKIIWESLAKDTTEANTSSWKLSDIRAGIPHISTDTVEAFVPQMVNLQIVNGVNFKKGCYPGQEVVARMQYLGKLKRRMYRAVISDESLMPKAGDEIYSPESSSGQGAGKVVNVERSPQGGYELLSVMEIKSAEASGLKLANENGPDIKLTDLPYAFDAA
ncbi:MAG: folate-binding protein, partial [Gammaproteobacteria bacterium]|nr:folate-binding protein [Gammaproteobacteria bacterium]